MCASYGLEVSADYREWQDELNMRMLAIPDWAKENKGKTVRPTGRIARNLNPIVRDSGVELAWWGYGPTGVPAKYPTINARSETLLSRATWKNGFKHRRALIPATEWFEYRKPDKKRFSLSTGTPMMIGAVTAEAIIEEGPISCYSMIMQPAGEHLAYVHDRMPLLLPAEFAGDWLDPDLEGDQGLIDAALAASEELVAEVKAVPA